MTTSTVTIPNIKVQLTVDQLVMAVRQLNPRDRATIAWAITDAELDVELAQLIDDLYSQPPVTDISDAEIQADTVWCGQQVH